MEPAYYAVIPAKVRYNYQLCPSAKLIYGEISALCNREGFCWATNGYIAKLYEVSERQVSRWIHDLEEQGLIYIRTITNNKRTIYVDEFEFQLTLDDTDGLLPSRGNIDIPVPMTIMSPVPMTETSRATYNIKNMNIHDENKFTDDGEIVINGLNGEKSLLSSRADGRKAIEPTFKRDADELLKLYKELYSEFIKSDVNPYINIRAYYSRLKPYLIHFGIERLKELLKGYIASDDSFYKDNAWSLDIFLSRSSLNRLDVFTPNLRL